MYVLVTTDSAVHLYSPPHHGNNPPPHLHLLDFRVCECCRSDSQWFVACLHLYQHRVATEPRLHLIVGAEEFVLKNAQQGRLAFAPVEVLGSGETAETALGLEDHLRAHRGPGRGSQQLDLGAVFGDGREHHGRGLDPGHLAGTQVGHDDART